MPRFVAPLLVLMAIAAITQPAAAVPQFFKAFKAEYLDENEDEAFVELASKAKCLVCHAPKEGNPKRFNPKERNAYGAQLDERLDKTDKQDEEKILAALKEVAELHSDPEDDDSPTFGELIASGKLPGGSPASDEEGSGGDKEE